MIVCSIDEKTGLYERNMRYTGIHTLLIVGSEITTGTVFAECRDARRRISSSLRTTSPTPSG